MNGHPELDFDPNYAMGHSGRETVSPPPAGGGAHSDHGGSAAAGRPGGGMNVLDLGCGVGDVSIMAARLIGHRGPVVAHDIDGAALRFGGGLPPFTQPLRNSPPSC